MTSARLERRFDSLCLALMEGKDVQDSDRELDNLFYERFGISIESAQEIFSEF